MNAASIPVLKSLNSHFDQRVSESLPLIFAAGCACCVLFLFECGAQSLAEASKLVILGLNSAVLGLFLLSCLLLKKWSIPPGHAHFVLFLTAMTILGVGSVGALLGQGRAYDDVSLLTILACGCFILNYRWLALTTGVVTAVWFQVRIAAHLNPDIPEVATMLIAISASVLFCHVRRTAYTDQYDHQLREQTLSEKLKGIWREAHLGRWETEEKVGSILVERQKFEQLVAERRASLIKLKASLEEARKSESLGRLAGGVAHDFNNLLTVIFFNLDELLESNQSGEIQADLESARLAAERVTGLTSQLLALSRRQIVTKELLDPVLHAKTLEPTLCQLLGEDTKVNLDFRLEPGSVKLEADPALMDRVLLTLAGSGKDLEKRGGEFTIRITRNAEEVAYLVTHSAWSPPDLDSPTVPYASGEDLFTGLGLSLAAVEGVIDQHDGKFRVLKDRGKTHYLLRLPIYKTRASEEPAPGRAAVTEEMPKSGCVLILEEDEQVRKLVARYLSRQRVRVYQYCNADSLLRDSQKLENASVLICDYQLTGSDGTALSNTLRKRWPQLKTIFMSGAAGATRDQHQQFLPKPFSLRALGESVDSLLRN